MYWSTERVQAGLRYALGGRLADHPAMLADLFRDAGGSAPVLTCVKTAVRVVGVSQAGWRGGGTAWREPSAFRLLSFVSMFAPSHTSTTPSPSHYPAYYSGMSLQDACVIFEVLSCLSSRPGAGTCPDRWAAWQGILVAEPHSPAAEEGGAVAALSNPILAAERRREEAERGGPGGPGMQVRWSSPRMAVMTSLGGRLCRNGGDTWP